MFCVRGVPGVTGTLGKANSHLNPNGVGDRITTLRGLLIGAVNGDFACGNASFKTVTKSYMYSNARGQRCT